MTSYVTLLCQFQLHFGRDCVASDFIKIFPNISSAKVDRWVLRPFLDVFGGARRLQVFVVFVTFQ